MPVLAVLDVVEADHGHLLGHGDPGVVQGTQGTEGEQVGEAEQGVGQRAIAQKGPGGVRAAPPRERVDVGDLRRGLRRCSHRRLEPAQTQRAGRLLVALGSDRDHVPPSGGQQVLDRLAGGHEVVDVHVVEAGVRLLAEEHHGPLGARRPAQVVVGQAERADDQAVEDRLGVGAGEQLALAVPDAVGLLDHERVPVAPRGLDERAGQLREVGVVEVGHHEPGDAGAAGAQHPADLARPVVELLDGGEHALPGAGGDVDGAAHDVRHGAGRDAREARDVLASTHVGLLASYGSARRTCGTVSCLLSGAAIASRQAYWMVCGPISADAGEAGTHQRGPDPPERPGPTRGESGPRPGSQGVRTPSSRPAGPARTPCRSAAPPSPTRSRSCSRTTPAPRRAARCRRCPSP